MKFLVVIALLIAGFWLWKRAGSGMGNQKRPSEKSGSSPALKTKGSASAGEKYVMRQGKMEKADEAFEAWTSGNMEQMTNALQKKTNPIDRHFLLMIIVDEAYKNRADCDMAKLCEEIAEKHLDEFKKIAPALKEEMDGILPRVTTFQKYATLLTEKGDYERAIEVCEEAMSYGLHDGTKTGFEGAIYNL